MSEKYTESTSGKVPLMVRARSDPFTVQYIYCHLTAPNPAQIFLSFLGGRGFFIATFLFSFSERTKLEEKLGLTLW